MPDREKHVVLGTAGHIDHGKTELIKALTGVDTDRLAEEKERGISIELGFARLELPSGRSVGVVDVPGHERFVKTMLAGAAGIDLVLLVVAADEGVMPQTREHVDIVTLLGIDNGIVALTKTDLVGEEELALAREDVEDLLAGTALEQAPVVAVSAVSRDGLEELAGRLDDLVAEVGERPSAGPARLPVDRVFSLPGHGTIVTGTLWSGEVAVGDRLAVYPGGGTTRVRSVQVHDRGVERAFAGQRTALGLHGLSVDDLSRGDTLAAPDSLHVSHMFDARLRLVPGAKPVTNRTRVHLHLGTAEVLARVVLLEDEALAPGGDELVQMRLESPLAAAVGDLFVVRSYSPMATIGGGRVIDPASARHKRMRPDVLESIRVLESGSEDEVALQVVDAGGLEGVDDASVLERVGPAGEATLAALIDAGSVVRLGGKLLSRTRRDELASAVEATLSEFAAQSPLEWGMSAEELRTRISPRLDRPILDAVLTEAECRGALARREGRVRWGSAEVELAPAQSELAEAIEKRLLDAGANPPSVDELRAELRDGEFDAIVKLLAANGRIVKVTTGFCFHPDVIADVRRRVTEHFESERELGVPAFKEMFGVTRKHAIPLLEYLDRIGVTRRSGNVRLKGPVRS